MHSPSRLGARRTIGKVVPDTKVRVGSGTQHIGEQGRIRRVPVRPIAGDELIKARNTLLRKHGQKLSKLALTRLNNFNRSSSDSDVSSISEDENKENDLSSHTTSPAQIENGESADKPACKCLSYDEIVDLISAQVEAQMVTLRRSQFNGAQTSARRLRLMAIGRVEDRIRRGLHADTELLPDQMRKLSVLRDYRQVIEEQTTNETNPGCFNDFQNSRQGNGY